MADTAEIPAEFNGIPTKYTFFDGFRRAGLGMKIVYVLGFPVVSGMMEAYRWNQSEHAAQDAAAAIKSASNGTLSVSDRKVTLSPDLPEINPAAAQNGQFQAAEKNKPASELIK